MSGNSRGFVEGVIGGIRVGGDYAKHAVTYFPAHSKNGANVSARCVVRGCVNIPARRKGMPEKQLWLNFTFWGKVADTAARSMSPGKEFDVLSYDLNQYEGQVYYRDPVSGKNIPMEITLANGQKVALKDTKLGFSVRRFRFGGESAKFIAADIAAGNRLPGWEKEGSQENAAWKKTLEIRNGAQFVPGQPRFGFANVVEVKGPGIGAYDYTKDAPQASAPMQATPAGEAAIMTATAAGAITPPANTTGAIVTGLNV